MRSGFYAEYTRLAPVLGTCIRLRQFNFRRASRFEAWLVRRSLVAAAMRACLRIVVSLHERLSIGRAIWCVASE